jgi:hypothetical protein
MRRGCEPKVSKESRKILQLLNDPKHRNHLVCEINLLDQDDTARVGGGNDREMKVLNEMNELQQFEEGNWSRGSV